MHSQNLELTGTHYMHLKIVTNEPSSEWGPMSAYQVAAGMIMKRYMASDDGQMLRPISPFNKKW